MAILAVALAGCATSVSFKVQRPPTWNTLGIKRLAVMPFTTTDNSGLQKSTAALLTSESLQRIQATNHFTLVNASEVERIRSSKGDIENITDAIFSGQVLSVSVQDTSKPGETKNKDGTVTTYVDYTREVRMSFSYNLTRTSRGMDIVGSENKNNLSTRSTARDDTSRLKSADAMVEEIIRSNMSGVGRLVAPHTVTESRKLEKETSKDKAIKERAKEAQAMVKAGSYRSAQNAYLGIYQDTGSIAAAYNAGLLTEVMGDTYGAISFYQRVYNDTGNPKMTAEIARLNRVIQDANLLEAYSSNQSQRDKVIALMVNTIPGKLPRDPRIAFVNNSIRERELAEVAIQGIMDGLLAKNITVIDRGNRELLDMERNYQLAGNVTDDEITRIGHEAGINTFVMVSVTGSGATRRLSVQMIDIERNTVLYQSPQSDEMNL